MQACVGFRLAILAALLSATPASAAPATAPAAAASQPSEQGLRLARAMQPPELLIQASDRMFRKAMTESIGADANFTALEKQHPGLTAAVIEAMSAATARHMTATMPDLQRRYARLYESLFTADEVAELIGLYSSPVGTKLVRAKYAGLDGAPIVKGIVADPDAPVAAASIAEANRDATRKAVGGMTAEDGAAFLKLVRPATLMKMKTAMPRVNQFETEIANEADPVLDLALGEAVASVMKKYGL